MAEHMGYEAAPRQESREVAALSPQCAAARLDGSLSLTIWAYSGTGSSSFCPRCFFMRSLLALMSCASILAASSALAETRVFIIPNQADGYGVDQCLAKGDKCGAQVARTYCQSRDFAQASAYRRVDPDEITGSVPKTGANCSHGHCDEYVAITCQR
jgi:hypothetical protein